MAVLACYILIDLSIDVVLHLLRRVNRRPTTPDRIRRRNRDGKNGRARCASGLLITTRKRVVPISARLQTDKFQWWAHALANWWPRSSPSSAIFPFLSGSGWLNHPMGRNRIVCTKIEIPAANGGFWCHWTCSTIRSLKMSSHLADPAILAAACDFPPVFGLFLVSFARIDRVL